MTTLLNNCPYCGSTASKVYIKKQECRNPNLPPRDFVQCAICGTIYPNPRLKYEEVYGSIPEKNDKFSSFSDYPFQQDPTEPFTKTDLFPFSYHQFVVRLLKQCIAKYNIKNALDIGASSGRFCFLLNELKIQAFGLEPQIQAVQTANSHDLSVFHRVFPNDVPDTVTSRKYDLITINECIYYFEDLRKSFQKISNLLSEKGLVYLKLHTGESYYYDNGASLFSRYGDQVQSVPTVASVQYWLNDSNYEILQILPYPDDYYMLIAGTGGRTPAVVKKVFNAIYGNMMIDKEKWVHKVDRIIVLAQKRE